MSLCSRFSVSLFCNSASGTKCLSQYCPQDTPTFTCTTTSGSLRWTPDGTLPTTPFTMEHSNIGVFVWLVNKTNEPQLLFKAQLTNKTSPNNLTSVLTATSPNVMGSTVRCSDDNEMKSLHVQLYGGRFNFPLISNMCANILFPPPLVSSKQPLHPLRTHPSPSPTRTECPNMSTGLPLMTMHVVTLVCTTM